MDGLNNEERLEAWKAAWSPSYDGWAIIDGDFSFRSINPQWLELLGVTPAHFIGKTMQDVTAPEVRELDLKNALLAREGKITSYAINKEFQFQDGSRRRVVALVVRVPQDTGKPFQFFLSRIMLNETEIEELQSSTKYPKLIAATADFMIKYGKWIAAIGTVVGSGLVAVFKE